MELKQQIIDKQLTLSLKERDLSLHYARFVKMNARIQISDVNNPREVDNCIITTTKKRNTTHTHSFNDPLSGTTQVSQYQKGKTNLDFSEARDSE